MPLTAEQQAAYHYAAQQQRRQQQPNLGDIVAAHIAHRIGMRITNGLEYVFWGACDKVSDGYHWMWPTTAEHVRKMAIFTRKDLDGFIRQATTEGRQYVIVQPHRITEAIRNQYIRDGYRVTVENKDDQELVKIAWGEAPVLKTSAKKPEVTPPKPGSVPLTSNSCVPPFR